MKNLIKMALIALPCSLMCGEYPKIDYLTSEKDPICEQALEIGKNSFDSFAFELYAPVLPSDKIKPADYGSVFSRDLYAIAIADNFSSELVGAALYVDISGGDEYQTNLDIFERVLPCENSVGECYFRIFHWQKNPRDRRLVIVSSPLGWQGDRYSLYEINQNLTIDELKNVIAKDKYTNDENITTVVSPTWRPPLILRDKKSEKYWVMSLGEPYVVLPAREIIVQEKNGLKHKCNIVFSQDFNNSVDFLPNDIKKLAILLDEAIGSGQNEGTLNPTAGIKIDARKALANLALRPWALEDSGPYDNSPYNSRAEIDDGLKMWSKNGKSYKKLYDNILRQYQIAEKALSKYYQKRFNLTKKEADKTAAWGLDIVYRIHFVFHRESRSEGHTTLPNPWREIKK